MITKPIDVDRAFAKIDRALHERAEMRASEAIARLYPPPARRQMTPFEAYGAAARALGDALREAARQIRSGYDAQGRR